MENRSLIGQLSREQLEKLIEESTSISGIINNLGLKRSKARIRDIKEMISKYDLSIIFKQRTRHTNQSLTTVKGIIRNYDKNKLIELLNQSTSLIECMRKMGLKAKFISQYTPTLSNRLREEKIKYTLLKKFPQPNIKTHYFKTINTKDKAYWLGFLAADGYIIKGKVALQLSTKDRDWLEKFIITIGGDIKYIKEYLNKNTIKQTTRACYALSNKKFSQNLIDKGFESPKSYNIHFPKYKDKKLELAFLMGYFDGDGNANNCVMVSCNENFLKNIKKRYNLIYEVKQRQENLFELNLGAKLFKIMLNNYKQSMPRKRKTYTEPNYDLTLEEREVLKFQKQKIKKSDSLKIKELIKTKPLTFIAKRYNCSANTVKNYCKKYKIKIPKGIRLANPEQVKQQIRDRYKNPEYLKKMIKIAKERAIRKYDYELLWKLYNEKKLSHKEIIEKHNVKKYKFYQIIRLMKQRNL